MRFAKGWTVAVLALSAIFLAGTAVAQDVVKIGVLGPLTGPAAVTGEAFKEGIALALDVINGEQKGVLGKKVEVIFEDTAATPEKAASAIEKLITKDKVALTCGESHSSCALAEIPIADRLHNPIIIAEAWADPITAKNSPYVFRAGPCNSGVVNDSIVPFIQAGGFKKVAIIAENSDWGLGIKKITDAGLTKVGIEHMALETDVKAQDFYAELNKIKNFKPDLVLAYIYGTGVHYFIKQANEVGVCPQTALILEGAGPPSLWPDFWKNVGDAGNLELFVSAMHPKVDLNASAKKFRAAYEAKFKHAPTDYKSRSIYGALLIAADAIRRAGSTDPDKIVAALETTNLEIPSGTVKFSLDKGTYNYHQWQPPMLIVQWQDKQQVVVYPPQAKQGELKKK